jgi:hypothetical protein
MADKNPLITTTDAGIPAASDEHLSSTVWIKHR